MMRQFAKRSPRAASGVWKTGAMAFGAGCGGLALFLAQREELRN
jgi:tRNA1(Val) A37 N6-methylase TrmN6